MLGLCRLWALIWFLLNWELLACGTPPCEQYDYSTSLQPRLSGEAQIFLPGSEGYGNATLRWSRLIDPNLAMVVAPKTERDIQETAYARRWEKVKYANEIGSPFLTIGGRHGVARALNNAHNAIGIWTRNMRSITVHHDTLINGSSTATIGPGVEAGELTSTLFAQGKTGASTACDCVGIMGAMLGGGHGFLQGRYGLTADNLVSARVVTADGGSVVTVSATQNQDLFWALRGAGHNFGVVASVEYRVFDRRPETDEWAYEEYLFAHDQLERVYELANGMIGGPVELTHYGHFERRADVDPEHLTVLAHRLPSPWCPFGSSGKAPKYQLGTQSPSAHWGPWCPPKSAVVDITQINGVAGANLSSPFCGYGAEITMSPVGLRRWNVTALRKAFDVYASLPPRLQASAALLEGYSVEAVQRVPADATAFPDRFNNLLVSPVMIAAAPGGDDDDNNGNEDGESGQSDTRAEMQEYANRFRDALLEGSGDRLYAYVNYASGDEGLEAIYGYDQWRLEKLRRLKQIWDPKGRMDFYNPIS
ncbi:hypothetical protein PG989_000833 [Apiospora arundinis]